MIHLKTAWYHQVILLVTVWPKASDSCVGPFIGRIKSWGCWNLNFHVVGVLFDRIYCWNLWFSKTKRLNSPKISKSWLNWRMGPYRKKHRFRWIKYRIQSHQDIGWKICFKWKQALDRKWKWRSVNCMGKKLVK